MVRAGRARRWRYGQRVRAQSATGGARRRAATRRPSAARARTRRALRAYGVVVQPSRTRTEDDVTQSTPQHRDGRSHRQPRRAGALDPATGAVARSTPTAKVPEPPPPPDLPPLEPDELPED